LQIGIVQMSTPLWSWFAVGGFIVVLLAADFLSNRGDEEPTFRRALVSSAAWIGISVAFGVLLGAVYGSVIAQQYFAGYLIEKSLSVDNIFVFALLFASFAVPTRLQHRVLYVGVMSALLMRGAFIAGGAALLERFSWVLYVFGGILVISGLRMLRGASHADPNRSLAVRAVRRVVPLTPDYVGNRFFTRIDGRRVGTPLLVALVAIEVTDLIFASDSIPAIFGVTTSVFVIFTSNAFAVLGLRALYFVFAGAMDRFDYLKYGLAVLLVFIGVKMLANHVVQLSTITTLVVIVVVLGVSMVASVARVRPRRGRGVPPGHETS
jgi:tellurite resistance protein TerC